MLSAAAAAALLGVTVGAIPAPARAAPPVKVKIGRAVVGHVAPGFLGLGTEYWALEASAGRHPNAIDQVFVQLLRNLNRGQTMVLRIGGGSTDNTWWPVNGYKQPPGVNYSLSASRLGVMKSVANQVHAKLLLGINLAEDSPVLGAAEARAMVTDIGASHIAAFELGNEPELYGSSNFPWYTKNGVPVPARPPGYDLSGFMNDFMRYGRKMPAGALAGPASNAGKWLGSLSTLIAGEPRLKMVTVHRYPLQACFVDPSSPKYPTIAHLLSPASSVGQAAGIAPAVAAAHAHHVPLRIDEMNSVSCGKPAGFNYIFGNALWALDALFADAKVGVDGVNIHTWPRAQYRLFKLKRLRSGWEGFVSPEYYGLLMFAQAAPAGAKLLSASSANQSIRAWATRAGNKTIRVVLINDDTARSHVVSLRIAGTSAVASVERLLAPSPRASSGVTIGGQSFGAVTTTGLLTGQSNIANVTPKAGVYSVSMPAASAALLTLP
jgi:Glycosyl hydrolase family 79 C-terminal beta domain